MFGNDFLAGICLVGLLILIVANNRRYMRKKFCPYCYSTVTPKVRAAGSLLLEVFLWLCFILPGVFYSLWRMGSKYSACPVCGEAGLLPLDSPRAKQMTSEIKIIHEVNKFNERD